VIRYTGTVEAMPSAAIVAKQFTHGYKDRPSGRKGMVAYQCGGFMFEVKWSPNRTLLVTQRNIEGAHNGSR